MSRYKYKIVVNWSDEDDCYIANVPELQGCKTHGGTLEETMKNIQEVIEMFLEVLKEDGKPIPEPMAERKFSGKLVLRLNPEIHRDLAIMAKTEGKSLNKFIEKSLEGIVKE